MIYEALSHTKQIYATYISISHRVRGILSHLANSVRANTFRWNVICSSISKYLGRMVTYLVQIMSTATGTSRLGSSARSVTQQWLVQRSLGFLRIRYLLPTCLGMKRPVAFCWNCTYYPLHWAVGVVFLCECRDTIWCCLQYKYRALGQVC